jgi:hypothetical protein
MKFILNNHALFAMDDRIERMDDMKGEPPKKNHETSTYNMVDIQYKLKT